MVRPRASVALMLATLSATLLLVCPALGDDAARKITVSFTVKGQVQTSDEWTTGDNQHNEWAKPMYRIRFDANGDSSDGPWGNGQGTSNAELWLDTGRVGFWSHGPDGAPDTGDEVRHWPLPQTSGTEWSGHDIEVTITGGKTLTATLPLSLLGAPTRLEIGVQASPWATNAADNIGPGSGFGTWLPVTGWANLDRHEHTGAEADDDVNWPDLPPNRKDNFELTDVKVVIERTTPTPRPQPGDDVVRDADGWPTTSSTSPLYERQPAFTWTDTGHQRGSQHTCEAHLQLYLLSRTGTTEKYRLRIYFPPVLKDGKAFTFEGKTAKGDGCLLDLSGPGS